ncbi:lipopolysaccharide transport periplasmic protein LptA [Ideonella sp.]|uniref:lipopolysaccharide transport periplasmic protein LptA n=1 Tax=Ideonella sp. TaxID=1929293 RepID=UPI0035B027FF
MRPAPVPPFARLLTGLAVLALAAPAGAERADRSKPMEIVSDGQQSATVDLKSRVTVISGNVVITQGTLQIKADRVEVREDTPGRFHATAIGAAGRPATFRQKRDRVDEYVEAEAARVEYDGAAERVRFVGDAQLRVLRASGPPDEASAAVISYEQRSDTITFEGGAPATPGAAPGRARLVFIPRSADAAASEPAR